MKPVGQQQQQQQQAQEYIFQQSRLRPVAALLLKAINANGWQSWLDAQFNFYFAFMQSSRPASQPLSEWAGGGGKQIKTLQQQQR